MLIVIKKKFKKWHILIYVMIFFCAETLKTQADQLAYLSKQQAEKAVAFLRKQETIMDWCACCDNGKKTIIELSKVYYQFTGYEGYFEIMIEGKDAYGNELKQLIDLAYIHYKKGNKAYCVGRALGFKCDPCTNAFSWD